MSSKINQISFKEKETFIGIVSSEQPRDSNEIVNDKMLKRSDLPRHADFIRAMDKLKPHLLIACGYQTAYDCNGSALMPAHFDAYFADSEEEKLSFGELEMTGILIQGKHAEDGVQLFGTKMSPLGILVTIKTPSIPLVKTEGEFNYVLSDILGPQVKKVLVEAMLYHERKKHGAGMQQSMGLPNVPAVNTVNQTKKEQANLQVA